MKAKLMAAVMMMAMMATTAMAQPQGRGKKDFRKQDAKEMRMMPQGKKFDKKMMPMRFDPRMMDRMMMERKMMDQHMMDPRFDHKMHKCKCRRK